MKFASTKLVAAALLLAACQNAQAGDVPPQLFVGTQWKIEAVNGQAHFADGLGTFSLDREGRLSTSAGCNGMGGSYTLSGNQLTVGPMMGTQMACMPEKKMEDERLLADVLGNKGPFTVKPDEKGVTLSGQQGAVIRLVPVEENPAEGPVPMGELAPPAIGETLPGVDPSMTPQSIQSR